MPVLSPAKLVQLLSTRPVSAAFFLHGEEEHLRGEMVDRVVDTFLDPATRDFNFDQLRGAETSPEALASILGTPPMMAEHRVVIVRDVQGLAPKAREVVESVVAAPPPGLVLVLIGQIPSGSKAKFYTVLQRMAASVEFSPVDLNDLPGLLIERAREIHDLELGLDGARALVSAIGASLGILASELEKLASYVGDRKEVTLEDVRAVAGYLPRVDRWAWFDLIMERRFPEALRLLPDLLESGESGVGLIIGMAGQLLRVGVAVAGGREALERELRQYQRWMAGRIVAASRLWTLDEIDLAAAEMLRSDRLLKSASMSDRQAMEELLLRLLGRLAEGRSAA